MKHGALVCCFLLLTLVFLVQSQIVKATEFKEVNAIDKYDSSKHIQTENENLKISLPTILTGLVFPAILAILTFVISSIRLQYSSSKEKNRYIDLLKINYPSVNAAYSVMNQFKKISQVFSIYYLFIGFIFGVIYSFIIILFSIPFFDSEFYQRYIQLIDISGKISDCYKISLVVFVSTLIIKISRLSYCNSVWFNLKSFKSNRPLTEKDNDFCELKESQKSEYYGLWKQVGLILGPYFWFFLWQMDKYLVNTSGSSGANNDTQELYFIIFIFFLTIYLSFNVLFDLYKQIREFPKNVVDPIINYHQCNYPSLMIKTNLKEFKGQLKNIQNEFFVTLCEENLLHVIPWNQIVTMDAIDISKSKCNVNNESNKKKSTTGKLITVTLILFIFLAGLSITYAANSPYIKVNDLIKSGRHEEALKAINKTIVIYPYNSLLWIHKGNTLYNLGKYDEAITAYDKIIEIDPQNANAWNNKGNSLLQQNKYDEAITAYDKAIEINPKYSDAWNGKGVALQSLNKSEEAITAYNKAIEINPRFSLAWTNKGIVLTNLDKYDEAITACDKAIEINPQDSDAWYNKGVALQSLNKSEEAITAYNKAIEINPQYSAAWNNKGVALGKLGKSDEAITAYDKAIEINPKYSDAWYNRACIYSLIDNKDQTIFNLKKATELDSSYKEKAKKDKDFNGIITNEKFKELVK
jgi:tetratricopeptide (TPR) repeat protein